MKKSTIYGKSLSIACLLGALCSPACTDEIEFGDNFIEKAPGGTVSIDTVFGNATYTEQYLTGIYALQYYGLPYNNTYTSWSHNPYRGKLDGFTDLYHLHWSSTTLYNAYYVGTLTSSENPLIAYIDDNVWVAVKHGWLLIENLDNVPGLSDDQKKRFAAEAKCLIAARYFDLFACYGGLPIVDHTFTGTETSYDLPRATIGETVDFMVGLLDEAIPNLPWACDGSGSYTINDVGRWTAAGAMALKAKILTFAASPLYNSEQGYFGGKTEAEQQNLVWYGNYDESRWQRAKTACKEFFDRLASDGYYALERASGTSTNAYRLAYRKGYIYQTSHEPLHTTRVRDYDNWSNGYYCWSNWVNIGRNSYLPTFEYMEMFPWKDGMPFDWKADSTKIFGTVSFITGKLGSGRLFYSYNTQGVATATRDPRLYENMIVTGTTATMDWSSGATSGDEYELWVGGYHEKFQVANQEIDEEGNAHTIINEQMVCNYSTGFGVCKYMLTGTDYQRMPLQWVYLGLNEMYLMYAECLAQTGELEAAIKQVDVVRERVGLSTSLGVAYEDVKTDKDALIEQILRERACELGMSNNRYYDMCRYKRADWITKRLHGLVTYRLTEDPSTGKYSDDLNPYIGEEKNNGAQHPTRFRYEKFELQQPGEGRAQWAFSPDDDQVKKWFLMPLPKSELNKNYGLVQNPGW